MLRRHPVSSFAPVLATVVLALAGMVRVAPVGGQVPATAPGARAALPAISDVVAGQDAMPGYFPLYWDDATGRLLLEVPARDEPFLYLTSLATGVGSNALGLDRGEIMEEHVARFDRVGPIMRLVLDNTRFRAGEGASAAMVRSVEESFPTSVIAAFDIVAEEDGRALVDGTDFFLSDAVDLIGALRRSGQGTFRLDRERSAVHLERTRAFPRNTEIEASLTFASDQPGSEIRRHTPDARSLTIRQHHSLVALPDPGYEPRRFDPRVGVFSVSFYDFSRSFAQDYPTAWAVRHRLEKRNPSAAMSEPVEPIVYYLDPAIPEPYRSAFELGGAWWNEVFEAAGFIDAFRIEDMPEDMDPMDARYNVIQWVHRTESGSSIGPSFRDPRTGEIIKAAVRMDSYRSVANYDTYAGAVGVDGDWYAGAPPGVDGEEFVMMRRRQHAAHEIGHTLGLAHNFISIADGHASVMDYPAPVIRLVDGRIDMSDAYRAGPGAYDTLAIRYAYEPPPPGTTDESFREALLIEAQEQGWRFITNPDAGANNAYPDATWWTNGADPLDELERVLGVRRFMLDTFDERAIAEGEPMHALRSRFAPVYFHHRATWEAALKTIGGMEYRYAVRGDPEPATRVLPAADVDRALDLLSEVLAPEQLAIPERILRILAPRSFGWTDHGTDVNTPAEPAFDQLAMARMLATEIVGGILEPGRAARVAAFHNRDGTLPTLENVIARLVDDSWGRPTGGSAGDLVRVVRTVVVDRLMALATDTDASAEARAAAEWGLRRALNEARTAQAVVSLTEQAHREYVSGAIERFLERGWTADEPPAVPAGPGWSRDRPLRGGPVGS